MKILTPEANLDLYSAPIIKKEAEDLIQQGLYDITLNLENCDFVDSSGIGFIIMLKVRLKKYAGSLTVVNIPSSLKKIMSKTGIPENFEIE